MMPTTNCAVFNELSATPHAENLNEASQWLAGLVDVMRRAKRLHFSRLRTGRDFQRLQLTIDKRLGEVISHLDRDRRTLLYLLTDSPYIDEANEAGEAKFLSHNVVSVAGEPCSSAQGLLTAHVTDTLAISFQSNKRWHSPQVSLGLERGVDQQHLTVDVPHACHCDHLIAHIPWASRRTRSALDLVPDAGRPLPNTLFSDQLVNDDWLQFYQVVSSLGVSEKTARLREMSMDVAFINGYDHSQVLSSRNSQHAGALRQVFVSAFTPKGHEFYLSTDFEKAAGAFEVYDRSGRHLGEWLFSGKKNGDADTSGRHNILL